MIPYLLRCSSDGAARLQVLIEFIAMTAVLCLWLYNIFEGFEEFSVYDSNLFGLENAYLSPNAKEAEIVGRDAYDGEVLTDDYQVFADFEGNLFASEENALKFYGVEEVKMV